MLSALTKHAGQWHHCKLTIMFNLSCYNNKVMSVSASVRILNLGFSTVTTPTSVSEG